ncbi:hypothetical protein IMG5_102040 [Ichthyophthirius multifiliis]|uniref:40S ribosomal protein S3 n=1 Tax=Ichthyophthirius multifiliis TaxID=5932 RepID=G0QSL5_ICHMU|nr:hypothetical protein IMG5_102040 [Ichthyophthirius multifiliis]EGR31795.1 hypothetical protein IMG5_102040 [Ichthyophthirius multifiliis]|eukprot:XP_004035281.1 hypothetical protein IMG5_102040 [Ichthyophthirius multifiliis]
MEKQVKQINKKKKFVADGVFNAELHCFFSKSLQDAGYAGIEVRRTPMKIEIRIKATKPQHVIGLEGKKHKELTYFLQKRFGYANDQLQILAEPVKNKGLCASAQVEALNYKLLKDVPVRLAANYIIRQVINDGAKGCEVIISGKLQQQRAKTMKFKQGYMICTGQPRKDYVDVAVRHVFFKQGIMGVKVKIMLPYDPTGKFGVRTPIPDNVVINEPKRDDNDKEIRTAQENNLMVLILQEHLRDPQNQKNQIAKLFNSETFKFPGPGSYGNPNQFEQPPKSIKKKVLKGIKENKSIYEDREYILKPKISQSTRIINYENGVPGPGQYKAKFNQIDGKIAYKFGSKLKQGDYKTYVCPTQYNPNPGSQSSSLFQPSYTFGYKFNTEKVNENPAPNTYPREEPDFPYQLSKQFSTYKNQQGKSVTSVKNGFGSTQRMKTKVDIGPGPGEYKSEKIKPSTGPSFKFPRSQRRWNQISNNPGPVFIGAFDPKQTKQQNTGFTLGQRLYDSLKQYETDVPGPGAYNGQFAKSRSGIKIGKEQKLDIVDKESLKKPGPNFYFPIPLSTKSEIYNPTIGIGERPPLHSKTNVPGPGQYNHPQKIGEGPKWKIALKVQKIDKADNPGPGAYDANIGYVTTSMPKYGMTSASRSNPINSQFQNTGPGSYNIQGKLNKCQLLDFLS